MEEVTTEPKRNYAGFGVRMVAYLIDFTIFTVIAYFIWGKDVVNTDNGFSVSYNNEQLLLPLGYMLLSWMLLSSSIGKMIFGLKIIDQEGNKIKPGAALMRIVGYIILFIGCWFIIGDRQYRQALHDRMAKTYVVGK
jgi:uncharacterized RDD family membrane protein YckC